MKLIPRIRPEDKPTNNADTGPRIMIAFPSLERRDRKAGKYAYVWFTIETEKRWKRMFIASHGKRRVGISMSGNPTIPAFENIQSFAIRNMNGPGTRMAMAEFRR